MEQRFSVETRAANITAMAAETVDLLVIGAGAVGAGVARDAAMRGINTVLVDKGDFASAASARASQILGEGPCYLTWDRLRPIVTTARERRSLLRIAPHLVQPRSFLFPVHQGSGGSRLRLRASLWASDWLARSEKLSRHQWLNRHALLRAEPRLKDRGLKGGVRYTEAFCDAARLVLATVRSAHQHGALVANYVNVEGLDVADGRARGAHVVDLVTGTAHTIHALTVVNAAGPWAQHLKGEVSAHQHIPLQKEVHVAVRRHRVGNETPLSFRSPIDSRFVSIIPSGNLSTLGTVTADCGDDLLEEVCAREADIVYLLRSANAVFPDARLKPADVVSAWAGTFPVPSGDDCRKSRQPRVSESSTGLVSVIGCRLSDHRMVAAQVVDLVVERLRALDGRRLPRCADTMRVPLPGGEVSDLKVLMEAAEREGLPRDTVVHLVHTFGSETPAVTRLALSEPTLARPIIGGSPPITAELVHSMRREMALTLGDLMSRRLPLSHQAPNAVLDAIEAVADVATSEMGWDESRRTAELAVYRAAAERAASCQESGG